MQHLLVDHPLLLPYARSLPIAMAWAAAVARDAGLTPEQAAQRLATTMEFDGIAATDGDECDG